MSWLSSVVKVDLAAGPDVLLLVTNPGQKARHQSSSFAYILLYTLEFSHCTVNCKQTTANTGVAIGLCLYGRQALA